MNASALPRRDHAPLAAFLQRGSPHPGGELDWRIFGFR
jgi:hypothetical protein